MPNYTFEDYKREIKLKYQEEASGGDYFNNLRSPTTANLRNLCIRRFDSNSSREDQDAFRFFFDFSFSGDGRNQFGNQELNRLESVKRFFLGVTENPTEDTVELAAVLVDFRPRPYSKFYRMGMNGDLINNITVPQPFITIIKKNPDESEDVEKKSSELQEEFNEIRKKELSPELINEDQTNNDHSQTNVTSRKKNRLRKIKEIIIKNFIERLKRTVIATVLIFSLIGVVVYFAFFKKHCMQWTGDRYEIVDCSSNNETNTNPRIPIDENLLDFRKVSACDTTTCFRRNGEAIVWYSKTANGIDFFNNIGNGWHPETNRALRPMTDYMFNRYLRNKPCN